MRRARAPAAGRPGAAASARAGAGATDRARRPEAAQAAARALAQVRARLRVQAQVPAQEQVPWAARANRAQFVFVKTAAGLELRLVRLGLTDFDYAEVLAGVKEGDEVALLSVAELQAKRKADQARLAQRMGSGVPGVPGAGGGGGGGGAGRPPGGGR
jgi:hypothetical protein